jgi:N6-adenosine-specific RNA methylase IME4
MGVGNYFRNSSELILFGVKGRLPLLNKATRTWFLADRKQHSRKPADFYRIVEECSPGPRIDIFSREKREGWEQFGDQCDFFNQKATEENYAGTKTTIIS